jgi:hypothetical protein
MILKMRGKGGDERSEIGVGDRDTLSEGERRTTLEEKRRKERMVGYANKIDVETGNLFTPGCILFASNTQLRKV